MTALPNRFFDSFVQLPAMLMLYLALVPFLRYRRRDHIQRLFPTRASYRSMPLEDAFHIQTARAELEFPHHVSKRHLLRHLQSKKSLMHSSLAAKASYLNGASKLTDIWHPLHLAPARRNRRAGE